MRITNKVYKQYPQYLHDMAVAQVAEEYKSKGYEVKREYPVGEYHADLFARKNGESIIFDINAEKLDEYRREKLKFISRFVKEKGYEFIMVFANTPRERKINLPELKPIFTNYFQKSSLDQLAHLAEKVEFEGVSSIDIDKLNLTENVDIHVIGVASITIWLIEPKESYTERFPFDFEVILEKKNNKLVLKEVLNLKFYTEDF